VASSILSGIFTQKVGYYVPSMILSPALMSVGEGLMSTWNRYTPQSRWIGYQFLAGFGLGFGMQTSGLAVQTVLPPADISTGIAINFFVQQLGGAVFTSVGQSLLTNLLASQLSGVPGLNPSSIVGQGATNLSSVVPSQYLGLVITAYNYACQRIFLASMGLAFVSLLCSLGMEWRSIKKGRQGPPGGPPKGPPGAAAAGGASVPGPAAAPGSPKKLVKRATWNSNKSVDNKTEVGVETDGARPKSVFSSKTLIGNDADAVMPKDSTSTPTPRDSTERKQKRLSKPRPGSTSSAETAS
jgi:hypothetical protein